MNTSTNNSEVEIKKAGGAFADGMTLIRFFLTPVVMFLIIAKGWPAVNTAILVTALFAIAALTDLLDDMTGGAENSSYRKYGWFDEIADMVLMVGTLVAMLWVLLTQAGPDIVTLNDSIEIAKPATPWLFIIPAAVIIGRELIVGLMKGFELSKFQLVGSRLSDWKTATIMFGTCVLLASPWLSPWLSSTFAAGGAVPEMGPSITEAGLEKLSDPSVLNTFVNTPDYVWNTGLAILWIGAILSVITGFNVLTGKSIASNDG